ncbi:hypothetical protein E4U41_002352 [Claviceps citrina]|nr:hypothetical protein E4U41_002352 [Claviceps citrina]
MGGFLDGRPLVPVDAAGKCPEVRSGERTRTAQRCVAAGGAASCPDKGVVYGALSPAGQASDEAFAADEADEVPQRRAPSPGPGPSGGRRRSPIVANAHAHGRPFHDGVHLGEGWAGGQSSSAAASSSSSGRSRFWQANKPAVLVALSQLFGAIMNLSARLLELEDNGMHPVQMLLLRQGVTSLCCVSYMWWMRTPGFPLGRRDIRWLLLARGCTGFFGIFGMWWSMMYLPLADATVITFLAPGVAGFACYLFLREPFTRVERVATLVALLGVVFIAQPGAFFASGPLDEASQVPHRHHHHHPHLLLLHPGRPQQQQRRQMHHHHHHPRVGTDADQPHSSIPGLDHQTTPQERILAVAVGLLGVLGAAGAFTTLRAIGKRAHPLISVNAFAVICTAVCVTCLALGPVLDIGQPSLRWVPPASARQWLLLLSLGVFGFVMQYLLTAGLAADRSNRANAMVYTHMLFAVGFDRWVFGHRMGFMSFAGCTLILGSALGVVLLERPPPPPPLPKVEDLDLERRGHWSGDGEGSPMLVGGGGQVVSMDLAR